MALTSEFTPPGLRIGIFGGSFDPPHDGHLHVARTALIRLELDRVWWLVSPQNPLKPKGSADDHAARLAATRRLAGEPRMVVTDIEARLGAQYTADTLAALRARLPQARLVWIMGGDNLASFHRWRGWRSIMETTPIAVVARPHAEPPRTLARATLSPAARAYAHARRRDHEAKRLVELAPPAWVYLTARLNSASSTELRARLGRA